MVDFKKYAQKRRLLEADSEPTGGPTDNPHTDSFRKAYKENGGIRGLILHFSSLLDGEMNSLETQLKELSDKAQFITHRTGSYDWAKGKEMLSPATQAAGVAAKASREKALKGWTDPDYFSKARNKYRGTGSDAPPKSA